MQLSREATAALAVMGLDMGGAVTQGTAEAWLADERQHPGWAYTVEQVSGKWRDSDRTWRNWTAHAAADPLRGIQAKDFDGLMLAIAGHWQAAQNNTAMRRP